VGRKGNHITPAEPFRISLLFAVFCSADERLGHIHIHCDRRRYPEIELCQVAMPQSFHH
jgi:hypothetical protein